MAIKDIFSAKILAIGVTSTLCMFSPLTAPPAQAQRVQAGVSWSGTVDGTTLVTIHGSQVRTQTIRGKFPTHIAAVFSHPLPQRPVHVSLSSWRGRGYVHIVQQPLRSNGYIAKVRIQDPQSGRARYSFRLTWHGIGVHHHSF